MGKYFKWGGIILFIIVFLALGAYFGGKLLADSEGKGKAVESAEEKDNKDEDTVDAFFKEDKVKESDLDSKEKIYKMIHKMANTLIIAEDELVWGEQPITKDRVEAVMKAMEEQEITDEKLWGTLKRWENQDYSDGVEDHNYVWRKYLDGTVGKAIKLRTDKK